MQHDTFDAPVNVLVGMGFPVEVATARQAFELMVDWPNSRRRTGHTVYQATCRIVMNGGGYSEQAREAFLAFAEGTGILIPDVDDAALAGAVLDEQRLAA